MEGLFALFFLFFIVNVVMVVWALIDAIRVPDDSMYQAGNKLIWVLVILFAGFIGAIVYLTVGRPSRNRGATGTASSLDANHPLPPPPGTG